MSEERTKLDSIPLLAWRVFVDGAEAMCIAFAPTRNAARLMARYSNWYNKYNWVEIKARREPCADSWVGNKAELLEGDDLKSQQVMHELGWDSIDEPSCEWCGAGQFEKVPESRCEDREDHDWQTICDGCYAREHSSER